MVCAMRSSFFLRLVYLCALVIRTSSVAISTQETLIVTNSYDSESVTSPDETEYMTEGPMLPVKLEEMQVRSEVALRYSRTCVTTLVRNPAKRSQETTFRILLPETAFISGFSMTIEGKKYDAYVKEKKEAQQIYSSAVSQGYSAAHIATKARDSNHLTVSVNVNANSSALFNLTYEELLVRHHGMYSLGINLHPGSVVANLTVVVHIKESQKITTLRVPEITTGNEIVTTQGKTLNTKAVFISFKENRDATVVFHPDIEEQKNLMDLFVQKSKEQYTEKSKGAIGLFTVQYDVDRTVGNEILINDGYFVHFFAPPNLAPLDKYVVFVLDTSGSMFGRKIQQLREAMLIILSELHEGDYFSIVEFDSIVKIHDIEEPSMSQTDQSKAYRATQENIAKAMLILNRLHPGSLTNIFEALDSAINLTKKGVNIKQNLTYDLIQKQTDTALTEASSQYETTTHVYKNLEPLVIFLTDGEANVGESNSERIISRITEKNSGANKAAIFSLAFGETADRDFLRKLSLCNDGFMRHIYEASDAALQLRDFYQQITSPLLSHVNFIYPSEQVNEKSLTKTNFRMYFDGSEMVVAGKTLPSATEISTQVKGVNGVQDKIYFVKPTPLSSLKKEHEEEVSRLERLWAYLTIKQLLDKRDVAEYLDEPKKKEDAAKEALELALKYSFVTELTSLVVVKPNETTVVDADSVDKDMTTASSGFGYRPYRPQPLRISSNSANHYSAYYVPHSLRSHSFISSHSSISNSNALRYGSAGLHGLPSLAYQYRGPYLNSPPIVYPSAVAVPHTYVPNLFGRFTTSTPTSTVSAISTTEPMSTTKANSSPLLSTISPSLTIPSMSTTEQISTTTLLPTTSPTPATPSKLNTSSTSMISTQTLITDLMSTTPPMPNTPSIMTTPSTTMTSSAELTLPTSTVSPKPTITPIPIAQELTTEALNLLSAYQLEHYPWVSSLLNTSTDELVIQINSTYVNLKLFKDIDAPQVTKNAAACEVATDGAIGVCVYLSHCEAARNISAQLYATTYCLIQDRYAGVCCPSGNEITVKMTTTASKMYQSNLK